MFIETTLYIKTDLLKAIDEAAIAMAIPRSRLVSILLLKYINNKQAGGKSFTPLQYQKKNHGEQFTTKHIYLRKDIYELWVDVRKLFKLSASHLIALSIKEYLDDILIGQKEPDNSIGMYVTNTYYREDSCLIQILIGPPKPEIEEKLHL